MNTTTFLAIYDEFSEVNPLKIDYSLNRAINRIDVDGWGVFSSEAICLLTAHFLASSSNGSNQLGGVVNKIVIEDDIEIGSAVSFSASDDLDLTSYGRQFKELKASVIGSNITCTNLESITADYASSYFNG